MDIDRGLFLQKVKESDSKSSLARSIGFNYYNGTVGRIVDKLIKEMGADISHFDGGVSKRRKYQIIEKECPVCFNLFETRKGSPREKIVCSKACSNSHFRSGPSNPNWKEDRYRTTCFFYHKKECVICGEKRIVDVHHYDEDHNNNAPNNLIPLCPTHHQYYHSRYRDMVEEAIKLYREQWMINNDS